MNLEVLRLAAFSQDGKGGNPAGVTICDQLPDEESMLRIAAEVGYSETAFLARREGGWRIRYFAPEKEVPFCGHATIASGAVLGEKFGQGSYTLFLNEGEISVKAELGENGVMTTTLHSPATWSKEAPNDVVTSFLARFSFGDTDLDNRFPVHITSAGAKHLVFVLKDRVTLAQMSYDFEKVREMMNRLELITVNVVWCESENRFHSRNAFAVGGVYEDPATGAAAAAFAGYLRDMGWPGANQFEIIQGEDMGSPSRLAVRCGTTRGESVSVTGETRLIPPVSG